jgi:hypothetical protein
VHPSIPRAAVAAVTALVASVALLAIPPISQAAEPHMQGASVISSGRVKLLFDTTLGSGASARSHYRIKWAKGSLGIISTRLTDGGQSVVLRTHLQRNARHYTVTATAVPGSDGTPMSVPAVQSFVGTSLGPNSPTLVHDDFNRPSGFATTDTPFPGPWLSDQINHQNKLALVPTHPLEGAAALRSFVSDTNPLDNNDNALVRYKIKSGPLYFASVYVYIPKQSWDRAQEIGLIRLDQFEFSSQARLSAVYRSGNTWSLQVRWKKALGVWNTPRVTATSLHFGRWYRIQLMVRNTTAAQKGAIAAWLNGRRVYYQSPATVANVPMTYAETGIMHLISDGPAAIVYFDQAAISTHKLPPMH